MSTVSKDRVLKLVQGNSPEQLAEAYLKARGRAEAAEAQLEAIRCAVDKRSATAHHATLGDIDLQGDPETVAALRTIIGGM